MAGPYHGETRGKMPLRVEKAVVVQAGTTQQVWVKWPVLENHEVPTMSEWGVECFENQGSKMGGKAGLLDQRLIGYM